MQGSPRSKRKSEEESVSTEEITHPTLHKKPKTQPEEEKEEKVQVTGEPASPPKGPKSDEESTTILETGLIYFFYRPRVEHEEALAFSDVQRMYFILSPKPPELLLKGREPPTPEYQTRLSSKRLIEMGKKKLPEIGSHARYWGSVDQVTTDIDELAKSLGHQEYETKTRGERTLAAMRPLGEGVYAIVMHHGHSHLAYVLEIPKEIGEVQKAFNIRHEGSYIIQIKNPEIPGRTRSGRPRSKRAKYPDELQEKFGKYKWGSADPPQLLDYEGAEILLVGVSEDLVKELGGTGEMIEKLEKADEKKYHRLKDDKLFSELHLSKKEFPREPLKGEWK